MTMTTSNSMGPDTQESGEELIEMTRGSVVAGLGAVAAGRSLAIPADINIATARFLVHLGKAQFIEAKQNKKTSKKADE